MGLLSILKKVKEKEKEIRVLMLWAIASYVRRAWLCVCLIWYAVVGCSGLDNAGKTTILKKFMGQDITEISPTLGFDIQTLEYKEYVSVVADIVAFAVSLIASCVQLQAQRVGCRRPTDDPRLLAQLL